MRLIVSVILMALLITDLLPAQQPATEPSTKQEIAALPSSSLVEVSVRGGGILRGHIVNRTDTNFSLRREKGAGTQTIAYDQVLSASQVRGGHSHKKVIIWVVVAVAVTVVVVGIVFAVKLRNFR
ncbi:MAG: hypothetical protein ACR2IV_19900 [Bryobacteraceae bacterium]